jgi:dTDP-4-amino-4,6-dideoxygalactose transaminase
MGDCPWYYEMQELGFNYRISDIHAALGLSQIKKLDDFVHKRRNIALIYSSAFKSIPYFDIPAEESYSYSSYHLYPIRIKDRFVKVKHTIFNMLHKKGIGAQVHYIPVYLQPYYMRMGFAPGLCPQSEIFYNKEISIPIYPGLKKQDVFHVIDVITEVFKRVESC